MALRLAYLMLARIPSWLALLALPVPETVPTAHDLLVRPGQVPDMIRGLIHKPSSGG